MKLYCAYSNQDIADHQCDRCDRLLCEICGYSVGDMDYCNECYDKMASEPKWNSVFDWDIEKEMKGLTIIK